VRTAKGLPFLKGHGTENDFVLLPDPEGTLDLTAELVQRLCDRRAGIGADGVLRVVPTRLVPEVAHEGAEWFMDYRNADGSIAEMCGNGIRVYARYLVDHGLAASGLLDVATRNGVLQVEVSDHHVVVDMGLAVLGDDVEIDGAAGTFVDMGNPHAVVHVPSVDGLGTLDPARKDLNVEYVEDVHVTSVEDVGAGHVRMRVHERGVGETRSCGTGACAAVVATSLRLGVQRGTAFVVDVPGGRLVVTWREDGHVLLQGPAVIVAEGVWVG
jgi:diaminopimelate epimerase